MKILMVSSFHHARGGDTTYARGLTRLLEGAGHLVVPLAMRHPDNDPSPWETRFPSWVNPWAPQDLLRRLALLPRLIWSREAARATAQLIAEIRPDVAHLHHVHRHLTPSVLGPLRAAGVPIVWTIHDAELICPAGTLYTEGAPCERCLGGRYQEAIRHRCKGGALFPSLAVAVEKTMHAALRVPERADRLICPSRYMAEALARFGLPEDRILHVPNFLEPCPDPGESPGSGWLYAGRLAPEKGLDTLLAAARLLPDLPLAICGAGPLMEQIRAETARMPQVSLLGHLPQPDLNARIRAAAVVAVPSRWPENFPYAVLEAQAARRAVVASRIGGIPEQIEDGVDGALVPPGDAVALARTVRSLVDEPERAASMGSHARARVLRERAPQEHLRRILSVYRGVSGLTS